MNLLYLGDSESVSIFWGREDKIGINLTEMCDTYRKLWIPSESLESRL